jgi:hypothetical protein
MHLDLKTKAYTGPRIAAPAVAIVLLALSAASADAACRRGAIRIEGNCVKKEDAQSYCGPGYRLSGNRCMFGYRAPKPQAKLPSWQVEGLEHGCKKGLAWNKSEGCHEND